MILDPSTLETSYLLAMIMSPRALSQQLEQTGDLVRKQVPGVQAAAELARQNGVIGDALGRICAEIDRRVPIPARPSTTAPVTPPTPTIKP